MTESQILFEFVQVGQQMRVAAIDSATGIEVIVITPISANRIQMQQLALAKLRRKLGEETAAPVVRAVIPGKFA